MGKKLSCMALVVLAGVLAGADDKPDALRSGPQVGKRIPGAFDIKNCNGPDAGDTNCQV
jgi:hypothetical protein